MAYVPFARKYRPQTFDELIGQPHVTETLGRALASQRLGQAYLFSGMRGVGKTSAARILAKSLNCEQDPAAAPCNACASCTQITVGNSLDVIEIDGASNRGIDEIRSLRETVGYAPTTGRFRVYIIDEVHMLTAEAFNALLKTLEEPPAHVKFIFATTAPQKLPATILSRCQRFDFRRLDPPTVVAALSRIVKTEKLTIDDAALYAIARASEGSLRDAEVTLEQVANFAGGKIGEVEVTALLGVIESDALLEWAQAIFDRDCAAAMASVQRQLDQGREPAQLVSSLVRHLRNLLVIAVTPPPARTETLPRLIDEPADRFPRMEEQAGRTTPPELLLMLQMLSGAHELIRRSPLSRTILELVVIKLATREEWQSLDEISRRLEALGAAAPPTTPHPAAPSIAPIGRGSTPPVSMASATPAQAAVPAGLEQVWPQFLEQLGAQKMYLAAYLFDARPLTQEQGTITIGLPSFALHHEVLSVLENRRLIERILSELCQTSISVEYATLPEGSPETAAPTASVAPADSAASPLVQEIVKLFNATVLDPPSPASP